MKALDLLSTACDNIRERGHCEDSDKCPMKTYCIAGEYSDTSVAEIFDSTTESMWITFLEFADECLPADIDTEDPRYWRDNF